MRAPVVPVLVAALVVLPLASSCGSAPETIDSTGIDELVIPTPAPDPDDFADAVDNPLLPLTRGSTWSYRRETGNPERDGRVVVTVLPDPREVAGVAATVVRTERTGARGRTRSAVAWFAQDRRGNVWLLGRHGPDQSWEAGEDGAEAGLAMPAEPRHGDSWATGYVDGEPVAVRQVVDLEATVATTHDSYGDAVVLEETSDGQVEERFHVAGVGLVRTLGDGTGLDLADVSVERSGAQGRS